ncbi:hypothetical protein HYY70_05000 [Candidatus Woesearchaeota archaeon]|nr:hypothetical protein [Candidatus Woesearchaeota archaeon]
MTKTLNAKEFIQKKKNQFEREKTRDFRVKDISRKGYHIWRKEAITLMRQSNYKEKVFVVERVKFIKTEGDILSNHRENDYYEYRIGYFIVGKIGKRNGHWTWGQYCPFIPVKDFDKLIEQAKVEGTILS